MPVAFPSHQGLILPLWRRYPGLLDGVALSVGAAMPDVVDALAWPFRGELGQWAGHSLVGVAGLCVPLGLVLTWIAYRVIPGAWLARLDGRVMPSLGKASLSLGIGALSHVVFDLVSHCSFLVLWPWYSTVHGEHLFPAWWCRPWAHVRLPVYKEPYPLAPHFVVWLVLTVLGAWLFARCLRPRVRG